MIIAHNLRILLTACLVVSASEATSLVERSPFLPPQLVKPASTPQKEKTSAHNDGHYLFSGVSKIGNTYYFSVLDKRTQTGLWLKENESVNGFKIIGYNPFSKEIEYSWMNQTAVIALSDSDGKPVDLPTRGSAVANNSPEGNTIKIRSNHIETSQRRNKGFVRFKNNPPNSGTDQTNIYAGYLGNISISNSGEKIYENLPFGSETGNSPDAQNNNDNQLGRNGDNPPIPTSRRNRVHNPMGKVPPHLQ